MGHMHQTFAFIHSQAVSPYFLTVTWIIIYYEAETTKFIVGKQLLFLHHDSLLLFKFHLSTLLALLIFNFFGEVKVEGNVLCPLSASYCANDLPFVSIM